MGRDKNAARNTLNIVHIQYSVEESESLQMDVS